MISLIAAIAENNVIGIRGQLPWHLPKDFAWFKSCTGGKPIIMGRKTFDSLERPLPKRLNIIISRTPSDIVQENVIRTVSLEDAIQAARDNANDWGNEIMIIGGGEIYTQALPIADRLYLTEVSCAPKEGDAFFPSFDKSQWQRTVLNQYGAEENRPAFDIVQYDRLK